MDTLIKTIDSLFWQDVRSWIARTFVTPGVLCAIAIVALLSYLLGLFVNWILVSCCFGPYIDYAFFLCSQSYQGKAILWRILLGEIALLYVCYYTFKKMAYHACRFNKMRSELWGCLWLGFFLASFLHLTVYFLAHDTARNMKNLVAEVEAVEGGQTSAYIDSRFASMISYRDYFNAALTAELIRRR